MLEHNMDKQRNERSQMRIYKKKTKTSVIKKSIEAAVVWATRAMLTILSLRKLG